MWVCGWTGNVVQAALSSAFEWRCVVIGSNGTRAKGVSGSLLLHKRAIPVAAVLTLCVLVLVSGVCGAAAWAPTVCGPGIVETGRGVFNYCGLLARVCAAAGVCLEAAQATVPVDCGVANSPQEREL